jgi:SAM-dependent methyltransferase
MLEVLRNTQEIRQARAQLRESGRSGIDGPLKRWLKQRGLAHGPLVGDDLKSWDVERTLAFIAERLPREAAILDLGAYGSEVPVSLARMGYSAVHGVDLNPAVRGMPMADRVRYAVGDFMRTPYADRSFDAVTATSVIEHGYHAQRLFAEMARLLRPGGFFIASFDYWPEKIDTGDTRFFDLSWLIFSWPEVQTLLQTAAGHGLVPAGPLTHTAQDRPIQCAGFDYTFGWLVLQREG